MVGFMAEARAPTRTRRMRKPGIKSERPIMSEYLLTPDLVEARSLEQRLTAYPTEKLVQVVVQIKEARDQANADFKLVENVLKNRMIADNATVHYADNKRIELKQDYDNDVRIDVLKGLETLVPAALLKKAMWMETPAPIIKTHITHLRALGKIGSAVQNILEKGIVRVPKGPPKLIITGLAPEQINVTETAPESLAA